MSTSPVRIDGPAERHAALRRNLVESRLGTDLVEADVHRLGGVEGADDRRLAVARQPVGLVDVDSQVVPAHEHMFAHWADGPSQAAAVATSEAWPTRVWLVAAVIS